ncbi:DUF3891 family protein [Telluribacter sp. SYSU D00476]|uniref:DUF3891 family protein n=1 Tax=Telluribacter sp. SYSU D00476 TaxID=2811430 RepID=UPI0021D410AF|nr:DUF3891 family protein [Telluribacter sp. SYSU D00476]
MIVKTIPEGWEVIYQRAHGLLAAQLANQWKVVDRPPYWTHTLIAIAEHDDGMAESQSQENLTEAGAPKHFQLLKYSATQYRNVMEIAASKSRWNALMTSLHMSFLYEGIKHEDKELEQFIKEQDRYQKQLLKELLIDRKVAEQAYQFVEWCDALSLLLCMDQVQSDQRRMDISKGPDGIMYQIWQDTKGTLRVDPWPFEAGQFEVEVEYRHLHQLQFKTVEQLNRALNEAEVQARSWEFRK